MTEGVAPAVAGGASRAPGEVTLPPPAGAPRGAVAGPSVSWLLAFRMAASGVLLVGGAMIHVRSAVPYPALQLRLYYGSLAVAFLLSLAIAGLLRVRSGANPVLLADIQVITESVVTTVLVYATGGHESALTFLFPLNTLYAAALVSAPAGYAVAVTGAASFAGVVALQLMGVLGRLDEAAAVADRDALSVVAATAGANMLVAMLAGQLSEQLRRSGETLRQARVDLVALQQLHSAVVGSVASGLISTDAAGRITLLNPAAERILGLAPGEAMGRPLVSLLRGVPTEGEATWEESYRRPDGEDRSLAVTLARLTHGASNRRGQVVTLTDVTEQRTLEAAMAHNRQLATVGQFAAGLAHELRNPLGSMLGCVELLEASAHAEPDDARLLGIVKREAERLATLVGDFLAYARPAEPHPVRLDVGPVLREVAQLAAQDAALAAVFQVDGGDGLHVRADAGQLRQVLWNLVRNAAQASPAGGVVTLSAEPARLHGTPAVRILVRDRGTGVGDAARARLFEPFFTTKPRGTGLGLAMVHRITEQHGGSVGLLDVDGPGACFHVTLPADDGSLPPLPAERAGGDVLPGTGRAAAGPER